MRTTAQSVMHQIRKLERQLREAERRNDHNGVRRIDGRIRALRGSLVNATAFR